MAKVVEEAVRAGALGFSHILDFRPPVVVGNYSAGNVRARRGAGGNRSCCSSRSAVTWQRSVNGVQTRERDADTGARPGRLESGR